MLMEVDVKCHTNIDAYKHENWPRTFQCRPEVGDLVESASGKVLKIVQLTHSKGHLNVELHFPDSMSYERKKEILDNHRF